MPIYPVMVGSFTPGDGMKGEIRYQTGFEIVGELPRNWEQVTYSLPLRIAAITRGLRRPWNTATTHSGFFSGA